MAFAAAAVVGARRGHARAGASLQHHLRPQEADALSLSGPNVAAGVATCGCAILVSSGLTAVFHSFSNTRAELVAEYNGRVESWNSSSRDDFASSGLRVTANWSSPGDGNATKRSARMVGTEASETGFRDSEGGTDLSEYMPLRYVSTFRFDSYYPSDGQWEALPTRELAPTVVFEFVMRSRNHSTSSFCTEPLPLAFDETVRSRTPAPENKCRREQRGTWRGRSCHVAKRLAEVCLQVEQDAEGRWQLKRQPPAVPPPPLTGGAEGWGNASSSTEEAYGCEATAGRGPAAFLVDACWGPQRPEEKCSQLAEGHMVSVTVRSAADPFIRAQELTSSTLDFGLSRATQRTYGFTMTAMGACLCVVPLLRLRKAVRRPRKRREGDCSLPEPRMLGQAAPM